MGQIPSFSKRTLPWNHFHFIFNMSSCLLLSNSPSSAQVIVSSLNLEVMSHNSLSMATQARTNKQTNKKPVSTPPPPPDPLCYHTPAAFHKHTAVGCHSVSQMKHFRLLNEYLINLYFHYGRYCNSSFYFKYIWTSLLHNLRLFPSSSISSRLQPRL